jgi:hypothetical protein
MKICVLFLTVILAVPALASSQKNVTVTGCVTKNSHNEYEIVDQKGTTYILYGSIVDLASYAGQFVSLVGDRSATPSTDNADPRPMPHLLVRKAHQASGTCKK